MTKFLQLPEPQPPSFSAAQVRASWRENQISDARAKRPANKWQIENLFVSLLHDVGRVLLIDGASKEVLFSIETGVAPTAIDLSLEGHYLYVLRRDGTVVSIDLQRSVPMVVASVRVGYEATAITSGGSRRKPWLPVGSQAPSQIVQLEPHTLEPLRVTVLVSDPDLLSNSVSRQDGRIEQIINLGRRRLTALMTTGIPGDVYVLRRPHAVKDHLLGSPFRVAPELRLGSADVTGRYAIFPTNTEKVAVVDSFEQQLLPLVSLEGLKGGSAGTSFIHSLYGPVWVTSSMFTSSVSVMGTDPRHYPENAWRSVQTLQTSRAGSMFVVSHPKYKNLWVDSAVSSSAIAATSVTVFDRENLDLPGKVIPLHNQIDLVGSSGRVLHPQYNAAGDELWLTVWNSLDRRSALVVIDDVALTVKDVIEDYRLITPTRTYSLATLIAEKRRP